MKTSRLATLCLLTPTLLHAQAFNGSDDFKDGSLNTTLFTDGFFGGPVPAGGTAVIVESPNAIAALAGLYFTTSTFITGDAGGGAFFEDPLVADTPVVDFDVLFYNEPAPSDQDWEVELEVVNNVVLATVNGVPAGSTSTTYAGAGFARIGFEILPADQPLGENRSLQIGLEAVYTDGNVASPTSWRFFVETYGPANRDTAPIYFGRSAALPASGGPVNGPYLLSRLRVTYDASEGLMTGQVEYDVDNIIDPTPLDDTDDIQVLGVIDTDAALAGVSTGTTGDATTFGGDPFVDWSAFLSNGFNVTIIASSFNQANIAGAGLTDTLFAEDFAAAVIPEPLPPEPVFDAVDLFKDGSSDSSIFTDGSVGGAVPAGGAGFFVEAPNANPAFAGLYYTTAALFEDPSQVVPNVPFTDFDVLSLNQIAPSDADWKVELEVFNGTVLATVNGLPAGNTTTNTYAGFGFARIGFEILPVDQTTDESRSLQLGLEAFYPDNNVANGTTFRFFLETYGPDNTAGGPIYIGRSETLPAVGPVPGPFALARLVVTYNAAEGLLTGAVVFDVNNAVDPTPGDDTDDFRVLGVIDVDATSDLVSLGNSAAAVTSSGPTFVDWNPFLGQGFFVTIIASSFNQTNLFGFTTDETVFAEDFRAGLIDAPDLSINVDTLTDTIQLTFPTEFGFAYQPQRAFSLDSTSDFTPFGSPIDGNGLPQSVTDSITGPQAFYNIGVFPEVTD